MEVGANQRGTSGERRAFDMQRGPQGIPGKRLPTIGMGGGARSGQSRVRGRTAHPSTGRHGGPELPDAGHFLAAAVLGAALPEGADERPGSYPGEFQSLHSKGAEALDDAAVQAGILGARRALIRMVAASPEYQAQRQNLAILQAEAASRQLEETGAMPAGHGWVGPGGTVLFDDPVHARRMLEQQIVARGVDGARDFVDACRTRVHGEPLPAGPSDTPSAGKDILHVLEEQFLVLQDENSRFEAEFERQSLATSHAILNESERRVHVEMERYGMNVDRAHGFAGASALDIPDTQEMQAAARVLLQSSRVLKRLRRQQAGAEDEAQRSNEDDIDGDFDADVDGHGTLGTLSPDELKMLARNAEQLRAAELEHERLRTTLEADYPALARYTDDEQLERVAQEYFGPRQVAWDLDENLHNIEQTRAALSDDLSVFRLPEVVEMTRMQMMVLPDSVRARIVEERVSRAQPSAIEALATVAIAVGLGIVAAVPTGGASVGTAVAVTTAQIAGVALEGYLAHDAVRQYQMNKAARGTDPDRARALSQEEPSLFWLAVDLVGAGLGGAAALETFRNIAQLRRVALASTQPGELVERLRALERLSDDPNLAPGVYARLTDQILDEHGAQDVAVEARRLLGDGTRSRQPLSDEELRAAIAYAEELGMSRKLIDTSHPHDETSWGQVFGHEKLYICEDLKPSPAIGHSLSANQRVSARGAIAHEIVGHRESTLAGRAPVSQSYEEWSMLPPDQKLRLRTLDEVEASLRAAKFAPGLSKRERKILFQDAEERLAKLGLTVDDVPDLNLYLHERIPEVR